MCNVLEVFGDVGGMFLEKVFVIYMSFIFYFIIVIICLFFFIILKGYGV